MEESMRRPRQSVQQSLASIVLGFELIVMFLAALVAFGLKVLSAPVALIGGAVLCLLIVATLALLRYRWAIIVGWVVQGIIVATGILVPIMFIIGALFAGMWVYSMVAGGRIDRQKAAAAAQLGDETHGR
jgi:Flp pilus assembly protein TadB